MIEDKGAVIYGFFLKKTCFILTVKNRYGKNDISCIFLF